MATEATHRPNYFLSCDWGTSRFRLRLVERKTLRVGATYESDRGIQVLNEQYQQQDRLSRLDFFAAYLREAIGQLPAGQRPYPVVVSGMASANIGLCELPYAELPLAQSGAGLVCRYLQPTGGPELLLISGVRGNDSMMRGEETQAIGLAPRMAPYGSGLLLLPGTHSKHLTFRDGAFTALRTYLTGELFAVLARHSILAQSVRATDWHPDREAAFSQGLAQGLAGGLSTSLFAIRAGHLLHGAAPEDQYYRLSGLLIGAELAGLAGTETNVFLAAAEPLYSLYRTALETFLPPGQLVGFDGVALERALLVGQRKVLIDY